MTVGSILDQMGIGRGDSVAGVGKETHSPNVDRLFQGYRAGPHAYAGYASPEMNLSPAAGSLGIGSFYYPSYGVYEPQGYDVRQGNGGGFTGHGHSAQGHSAYGGYGGYGGYGSYGSGGINGGGYSSYHSGGGGGGGGVSSASGVHEQEHHDHGPQHYQTIHHHYSRPRAGGKGGKGTALSALTLLAFLFFLNLLQSCLKEHMDAMNPTVMVMTAGANREMLEKSDDNIADTSGLQDERPVFGERHKRQSHKNGNGLRQQIFEDQQRVTRGDRGGIISKNDQMAATNSTIAPKIDNVFVFKSGLALY